MVVQFARTRSAFVKHGCRSETPPDEAPMTTQSALLQAVQQYFNLMYDADVSQFDRVFRPTAQLHGLRQGQMRMITAQAYREMLAAAPSPSSLGARRQEEILM